jgi:hypothetical protein
MTELSARKCSRRSHSFTVSNSGILVHVLRKADSVKEVV